MRMLGMVTAATLVLLTIVSPVSAGNIFSSDVENDGTWYNGGGFWSATNYGGLLNPYPMAGSVAWGGNGAGGQNDYTTADVGATVQPGVYTVTGNVGNWSNAPFPTTVFNIRAGGANFNLDPYEVSATTPAPAPATWETWTKTYDVPHYAAGIGQPLTAVFWLPSTGSPAGNAALDGPYTIDFTAGPPPPAGEVIRPSFANGTTPSYGSPILLVNGAGLLGTGPEVGRAHQTTHTQGWLINNTNGANEVVFTMQGKADLNGMYVWQYSQGTCCTGRGVSTFDLEFSTDGGATYPTSMNLGPLAAASGTSDETVQWVSFAEQTGVTHVKITGMQDFPSLPSPGWQGLNEVRFQGVPSPPEPGHFGNTVSSRLTGSDTVADVFWTNGYGAPVAGTIDAVKLAYQGQSAGYQFELFQLRPTGTANQYDVIASSGPLSPPGSGSYGEVEIALANPFSVEQGDLIAHYGNGIPYQQNITVPEAHNNQVIYYSSPSAPVVGSPITVGSGGFPQFGSWRDYAYAFDLPGFVETVGNGAGKGGTQPDGATDLLVVMDNDPFTQPGFLDTWQFFNDTAGTGGRNLTPVLLRDDNGTLEAIGVGTTRIGSADGFQQYDFDLVAGTNVVEAGDLFGFYYGDQQGGNAGSVQYTEINGSPLAVRLFRDLDGIQLGDLFATPAYAPLPRFYSINASTIIPEPGSLTLLVLGGIALAGYLLRRRRR